MDASFNKRINLLDYCIFVDATILNQSDKFATKCNYNKDYFTPLILRRRSPSSSLVIQLRVQGRNVKPSKLLFLGCNKTIWPCFRFYV